MFHFALGRGLVVDPVSAKDVAERARRAAEEALTEIQDFDPPVGPSIVFVYMTSDYYPYKDALKAIADVLSAPTEGFKKAPMIGGTVSALVDGATPYRSGLAVWILASEYVHAAAASASGAFTTSREARIREALSESRIISSQSGWPGFLFTIMPGYKSLSDKELTNRATWIEDAAILECVARATDYDVAVFGNSTSDSLSSRDGRLARQFLNGRPLKNSIVMAWVESGLKFGIGLAPAYRMDTQNDDTRPELVTAIKGEERRGCVIERIGNVTAETYIRRLNSRFGGNDKYLIGACRANGAVSVAYPFRSPNIRGSATIHPELDLWTMLVPMRVSLADLKSSGTRAVEAAVDAAKPEIRGEPPALTFLSSCRGKISRIMKLDDLDDPEDAIEEELTPVQGRWPESSLVGVYGTGEQGSAPPTDLPVSQTWSASALVLMDELNEEAGIGKLRMVDNFLRQIAKQSVTLDSFQQAIVSQVNETVLGGGCSVFLRSDYVPWYPSDDHGRFVLVATSGLTDADGCPPHQPSRLEIIQTHSYAAGEGLTGWVAKYGVPLRLESRASAYLAEKRRELMDSGQVEALPEEDAVSRLLWEDKVKENRPDDEGNSPFLAVPLKLGTEIIGVVRSSEISQEARDRGKTRFSSFDEGVLEACSRYVLTGIALSYRLIIQREAVELVVRRVGHAVKSAAGLVGINLALLRNELGRESPPFRRTRDALAILKRAGELSTRYWRANRFHHREAVDVVQILDRLASVTSDRRVEWKKPSHPILVLGSAAELEGVFLELVHNAREFTDRADGKISLSVCAEQDQCVVHVIDNGPGVQMQIRDSLFKSFVAWPDLRLGMALAVAARVVAEHDGTIAEQGAGAGAGADFCVSLPLLTQ